MTNRAGLVLLIVILLSCLLPAAATAQEGGMPPGEAQRDETQSQEDPPGVAQPGEPQSEAVDSEQGQREGPRTGLDEARALIESGRPLAALEVLRGLPHDGPDRTNVLFNRGLAALAVSGLEGVSQEARTVLLTEAVTAFRLILIDHPELVRVRLELARAFFMAGRDELARRHFELVLASPLPPPVVVNIHRFLDAMRDRNRLTGYFGAAAAPDSNLNYASQTDVIYLDTVFGRLPFRRDDESTQERSGIGLSIWGGGEYQVPVIQPLRMRLGADFAQREYGGKDFDLTFLAAHVGPRWLVSPRTDISLLGTAHRQWLGSHPQIDEQGVRLEINHQLASRFWLRGTAAARQRECHGCEWRDGPLTDFTFAAIWNVAPTLQTRFTVGYERDYARLEHWRSLTRWVRVDGQLALPLGFTLGGNAQMRRTHYAGDGRAHFTLTGTQRRDRMVSFGITILNRAIALFGFGPQIALFHDARWTNAQAQNYDRNRAELRLVRQF